MIRPRESRRRGDSLLEVDRDGVVAEMLAGVVTQEAFETGC